MYNISYVVCQTIIYDYQNCLLPHSLTLLFFSSNFLYYFLLLVIRIIQIRTTFQNRITI